MLAHIASAGPELVGPMRRMAQVPRALPTLVASMATSGPSGTAVLSSLPADAATPNNAAQQQFLLRQGFALASPPPPRYSG